MTKFHPPDVLEDLAFLDETGVGATEAAERTGFASPEAMERWLARHDNYPLWLRMKHRDPEGAHAKNARRTTVTTIGVDTTAALLDKADKSALARTRKKGERVRQMLDELRVALEDEKQRAAEREQARKEVERLQRQLADARARLKGESKPGATSDAAEIRAWARENGVACPAMGRVPAAVREQYERAS